MFEFVYFVLSQYNQWCNQRLFSRPRSKPRP